MKFIFIMKLIIQDFDHNLKVTKYKLNYLNTNMFTNFENVG